VRLKTLQEDLHRAELENRYLRELLRRARIESPHPPFDVLINQDERFGNVNPRSLAEAVPMAEIRRRRAFIKVNKIEPRRTRVVQVFEGPSR
jgi:hypothetical protein